MHRARSYCLCAFTLLTLSGTVHAQPQDEEGPIILGRGPTWKWFELERLSAFAELEARYSRDQRDSPGFGRVEDTETLFRETLGLEMLSYFGRPEVFRLQGTAALSFRQSYLDRELEGGSGQELDWENLYDIQGRFIEATRLPITLYSRRHQSFIDRPFAPTVESTTTEHGAIATIRSEKAPTTFRYFHREQEQSDRAGQLQFDLVQDTFQLNSHYLISPNQRLQLDYTYDNIEESSGFGFDNSFERHDLALMHTVNFGRGERSSLRSTGRYFKQIGGLDQERIRLDELLRLVHTDRFETNYSLNLERTERAGATQDFIQGRAGLRHRLFESLITTANIGASQLSGEGFENTTQFGDVGLRYTKKVPYGRFSASAGLGLARQELGERGQPLAIINEPHVFNDPQPIVIIRRNILPDSIVVSDAADIRIFVPGVDYTLRALPDRLELRRVLGGAIAEGETVLVDYIVGPEPASTVDTTSTSLFARYSISEGALSGLSIYGSYRTSDQSLVEGVRQDFLLNDVQVLLYGADYRIGGFTFSAEREHHESDVLPFDALRFDARYDHIFGRRSTLTLGGSHETIDYREPDNQVKLSRLFATWNQELGREFDMQLHALYRNEENDLSGDLQAFEQTLEVRWRRRQTEIRSALRNVIIDADGGDSMFQSISLAIRRNF